MKTSVSDDKISSLAVTGHHRFLSACLKGAALVLLIALAYKYIPFHNHDEIKSFIKGFGLAAPAAFILICIIKPLLFFLPSMGLTIIAGTLIGPLHGTFYVAIGGAGSTAVGFYMTRLLGRQSVERLLNRSERMLKIDKKMEDAGFKNVPILRLFKLPWDIKRDSP